MPWEADFGLDEPKEGYAWRHQVFGGVYRLSRVRDTLVKAYGQDDGAESPPAKGESAMFTCTLNENGFLIEGSAVVSECAWAVGRVSQGKSVLDGFREDTQLHGDHLRHLADATAGLKLLGTAILGAVPDGFSAGVSAAVTGVLAPLAGPLAAAAGGAAGSVAKTVATSAVGGATKATTYNANRREAGDLGSVTNPDTVQARLDTAAVTANDLQRFNTELATRLGISTTLRPKGVRVRSYQVKASRDESDGAQAFLNSFIAEDLGRIATAIGARDVGQALTDYLTPTKSIDHTQRHDVRQQPQLVLDGCHPGLIPPGHWVTDTDRPLAFSQQFAVNRIMHTHGTGQPGVFAVNGPPGTGKTTMLRDLITAVIVQRAMELASLNSPGEAFTNKPCKPWPGERTTHRVVPLAPRLTGHEIVVASSNNVAVENVTAEIPGPKGIGAQWRDAAAAVDYFTATALQVTGDGSWALIAAVLGNAANRSAFVTNFWYGGQHRQERSGDGMRDVLQRPAEVPDWRDAVDRFRRSLTKVQAFAEERTAVSRHISSYRQSVAERNRAAAAAREAMQQREDSENDRGLLDTELVRAHDRWQAAYEAVQAQLPRRPGWLSILSASGRRARHGWDDARDVLQDRLERAEHGRRVAKLAVTTLTQQIADLLRAEESARNAIGKWDAQAKESRHAIEDARRRWGDHVPDGKQYDETHEPDLIERRELSAPWADEEFTWARTELFLAALALHKAFVLAEARRIRANLNALMDILTGKGRPEPAATLAAWQTLFLVVPVVSSTFASFSRLFAGLGRESLGWLLVDEAGQAAPQNVVGALWRSRTAVIVGDPLQLKPVVTLPWLGQRALLREFGISEEWAPSRTSVQQVADRLAIVGTPLPGAAGEEVWVGTPLRVHRRCGRPMFEVSNRIAYNGLMVFGTPERDPFHGKNAWYDVPSGVSEGHWIPAEGVALRRTLQGLHGAGISAADIYVLSPFRAVADEAGKVYRKVFAEAQAEGAPEDAGETRVGTVHIMQGREAEVVIMVLGGDPRQPGARRFAVDEPNLLNVAVTRARRRFYVIGNREIWGYERYFSDLKDPALMYHYRQES